MFFLFLFPLNLYVIINCLKSILIGLQFLDSVYHLTQRFVYFCSLLQIEELLSTFLVRQVVITLSTLSGKAFFSFISE